jgi:3-oxoacyl-[acyl-carrier-protein] synthase-3
MMIGIKNIEAYIPAARESNYEKKAAFAIDDEFIQEKIGVEQISRCAPDEQASDLCVKAYGALVDKTGFDAAVVECIIVCTQNPDGGGIPHVSAIVHGKIGAGENCACFDIGLGCSGYVYSLSVAKAFMEANGFRNGLLFTADPYSKIVDPLDKNTVLLFGDAGTVTHLTDQGERWIPKDFLFGTKGKDGDNLKVKEGRLAMNGRAVFNFSALTVPPQIRGVLEKSGLASDDIDLYFFHQGSKFIVDTLVKRLDLDAARVPTNLAKQGNTVSSSIPLLLQQYLGREGAKRYLLSGFGVGLSWASCILEKN